MICFPCGGCDYSNTPHWGAIWCLCRQAFPGLAAVGPRLFPKGNPRVSCEPFLWFRLCFIRPKPVCTSWKIHISKTRLSVLLGGSPPLSDSPQSTFPVALGTEQPIELTGDNSSNATLCCLHRNTVPLYSTTVQEQQQPKFTRVSSATICRRRLWKEAPGAKEV